MREIQLPRVDEKQRRSKARCLDHRRLMSKTRKEETRTSMRGARLPVSARAETNKTSYNKKQTRRSWTFVLRFGLSRGSVLNYSSTKRQVIMPHISLVGTCWTYNIVCYRRACQSNLYCCCGLLATGAYLVPGMLVVTRQGTGYVRAAR